MAAPLLTLAPDEHSGRKLGKYEILCRLSTGGMSEIFLAFQRGLAGFRKYVVLKQILPDIKGEEEFVQMFLDEARITAAFTHPNIAQVFDLDIQEGELFLAMEFVPGATLVEVARATRQLNEPIPIGFTLQAVRDTALALHYAHTFTDPLGRPQTVIHRDIAEKNIMVTYEGVTKLLDFGIAKALGHSSRTSVGMVKGTSGYMSPEQILGEPLDARSDIFALGVVLHECLTGMRLFHGRTAEDAMMQALKSDVLPPSATNKSVPPELDPVTLKALQRKRDDRHASALEFARAIERAAAPHIWHPEQSAEFVTRLFAQRRDATRKLMSEAQATGGEMTGQFKLAKLLGNELPPPPVPAAPPPPPVESPPPSPSRARAPLPKTLGLEPKTVPAYRREPPPPPVEEPPTKPPERAAPRKRPPPPAPPVPPAPPARMNEDLTTPGIRPEQLGLAGPSAPPVEERTVPGASLSELLAAAQPPKTPRPRPRKSAAVEAQTVPARGAMPKHTEDNVQTVAAPMRSEVDDEQTFGNTLSEAEPPVRRGGGVLWVAALLGIAAIGGTVFALGVHHELAQALGMETPPEQVSAAEANPPLPIQPSEPAAPVAEIAAGAEAPKEADAEKAAESPEAATEAPALTEELEPLVAEKAPESKAREKEKSPTRRVVKRRPQKTVATATEASQRSPSDQAWEDAAADKTPPASPKQTAAPGLLTLVTEPYATVFLGGRELGQTPLVKLSLKSGKHVLRLVDADGKKFALPVEISPDEETKVRVPLSVLKPL